jgi:hypothetical protein
MLRCLRAQQSGVLLQIDLTLEKKKEDLALKIAQGDTNVLQCEDVFEGLAPEVRCLRQHQPTIAMHCHVDSATYRCPSPDDSTGRQPIAGADRICRESAAADKE